jgi:hypothetical protein
MKPKEKTKIPLKAIINKEEKEKFLCNFGSEIEIDVTFKGEKNKKATKILKKIISLNEKRDALIEELEDLYQDLKKD